MGNFINKKADDLILWNGLRGYQMTDYFDVKLIEPSVHAFLHMLRRYIIYRQVGDHAVSRYCMFNAF